MALLQLLLGFGFLYPTSEPFNLESSRAIIYEVPGDETSGGYFGMSVALRAGVSLPNDTWIIQIGAPRGRGGSVYRCATLGPCRRVAPDAGLAASGGRGASAFREKKDAAWLGVAMDVARERSVVCGHRWMNQDLRNPENIDVTYLVTGACYLQNLLDEDSGVPAQRLLPLADKDKIYAPRPYVADLSTYHWGLGQAGISVKLLEEPRQLLIGAPGVTHWVGSVVLYGQGLVAAVADFARSEVARRSRYSYLGYSVAAGRFYKDEELWYVAGAPRSANYRGEASSDDVLVRSNFVGDTFGEYFGSSLTTADVNGDGLDDLVVGAPLFSNRDPDEGRIYVYLGTTRGEFLVAAQVINGRIGHSRFGACVASLRDLDQDGYGDLAVGAPYEENNRGAVYVYRGFPEGLQKEHSQRLDAKEVHPGLRGFGISISPAVDVDGNAYLDIAVGSYLSGQVVLFRSRPVISLHPKIRTENGSLIDRKASHFNVTVCSRYAGSNAPDHVDVLRIVDVDPAHGRGKLDPKTSSSRKIIRLRVNQVVCEMHTVLLNVSRNFSPLKISVRNEINPCFMRGSALLLNGRKTKESDEFPKSCPMGNNAEASKEIAFAGACGIDFTCRPDLELSCAVPRFRNDRYTLGSAEFLVLSMEVKNHGEPAYGTKIKIWSNLKLKHRDSGTAWEASRRTYWLHHDGILAENYKTNFSFQIDFEAFAESPKETHLNLMVEIFTSSSEANLKRNNCKFSVMLQSDAVLNFYASSSVESAYVAKATEKQPTLRVTHFYEVQKTGASPLRDVQLAVFIPFHFKKRFLSFEVETAEWMHFSLDNEKPTLPGRLHRGLHGATNSKEDWPPANRTLFLNCSRVDNECHVLRIFFTAGIPSGFSSYVKILIALNMTAIDLVKMGKEIVHVSTTGVLEFAKFLEGERTRLEKSASVSLYSEEGESHVGAHVIALSVLAGGLFLSLIVTGLARSDFFKRVKKQELKALRDADASFVYFATANNLQVT